MKKLILITVLLFVQNCTSYDELLKKIEDKLTLGNVLMNHEMQSAVLSTIKLDNDNLLFSPLTLTNAIPLCLSVTNGNQHRGIARALSINQIDSKYPEIIKKLLAKHMKETVEMNSESDTTLSKFNGLIVWQPNLSSDNSSSSTIYYGYQDGNNEVKDLRKVDRDVIQKDIDAWIEKKNEYLKYLTEEQTAHKLPHACIYSYLNVEAEFRDTFRSSGLAPFRNLNGDTTSVEMLSGQGQFPYYNDQELGITVVGLPLKDLDLTMYLMVANDSRGLMEIQERLTSREIVSLIDNAKKESRLVDVTLPKLKLKNTLHLSNAFKYLGMYDLFYDENNSVSRERRSQENAYFNFTRLSFNAVERILNYLKEREEDLLKIVTDNISEMPNKTFEYSNNIKRFYKLLSFIYKTAEKYQLTVDGEPVESQSIPLNFSFVSNLNEYVNYVYNFMKLQGFISDNSINFTAIIDKYNKENDEQVEPSMNKHRTNNNTFSIITHLKNLWKQFNNATENLYDHNDQRMKRNAEITIPDDNDLNNINEFLVNIAIILEADEEVSNDIVKPTNFAKTFDKAKKIGKLFYNAFKAAKSAKNTYDQFKDLVKKTKKNDPKKKELSKRETIAMESENDNLSKREEVAAYLPLLRKDAVMRVYHFVKDLKSILNLSHTLVDEAQPWSSPLNLVTIEKMLKLFIVAANNSKLLIENNGNPNESRDITSEEYKNSLMKFMENVGLAFETFQFTKDDLSKVNHLIQKLDIANELNVEPGKKMNSVVKIIKKVPKFLKFLNNVATQVKHLTNDENIDALHKVLNKDKKSNVSSNDEPNDILSSDDIDFELFSKSRQKRGALEVSELNPMLYMSDIQHIEQFLDTVVYALKTNMISPSNSDSMVQPLKLPNFKALLKLKNIFGYIKEGAQAANLISSLVGDDDDDNTAKNEVNNYNYYSIKPLSKRDVENFLPLLKKQAIFRIFTFIEKMQANLKVSHTIFDNTSSWEAPENLKNIEHLLRIFITAVTRSNLVIGYNETSNIPIDQQNLNQLSQFARIMYNAFNIYTFTMSDLSQVENLVRKVHTSDEVNVEPGKLDVTKIGITKIPKFLKFLNNIATHVKSLATDKNIDALHKLFGSDKKDKDDSNNNNIEKSYASNDEVSADLDFEDLTTKKKRETSMNYNDLVLYNNDIEHITEFLLNVSNVLATHQNLQSNPDNLVEPIKMSNLKALFQIKNLFVYIKKAAELADMLSPSITGYDNVNNDDNNLRSKRSLNKQYDKDMFGKRNIFFSDVLHNANFLIKESQNRKGSDHNSQNNVAHNSVIYNRPFFFVIKHEVTGAYVFNGMVFKPEN